MNVCAACGQKKPNAAIRCPHCQEMDHDVAKAMIAGTPSLTLLIIAMLAFWGWRFWQLGTPAWSGNIRFAALVAAGLGVTTLVSGPLWTFGIRSRKIAAILLAVAAIVFFGNRSRVLTFPQEAGRVCPIKTAWRPKAASLPTMNCSSLL